MNQIVLITGATAGLGLSLAVRFLEAGDRVYGVSRTKRNWASARKSTHHSKHFFLLQGDLTSEPGTKRIISKVLKREGRIDILINNAGYANCPVRTEKESVREFQKNFSNNLLTAFLTAKHSLPSFRKKKKGWIINISSMAGKRAVPRLAAYSASKFGVVALSQAIAKENLDIDLKCITVCPGGMNTTMRSKLFGLEDAAKQQSPEFVADKIMEIIGGKIDVPTGGDIVIRHGQITAINPAPGA